MSLKRKASKPLQPNKCKVGRISAKIEDITAESPLIRQPTDRKLIWDDLKGTGISVVRVITEEKALEYLKMMHAWLKDLNTGMDPEKLETVDRVLSMLPSVHGIVKSAAAGQAIWMWLLRMEPSVMQTFATIHNVPTSELITSFDGFGWYPAKQDGSAFAVPQNKEIHLWPHKDQDLRLSDDPFMCIQGVVYLSDNRKRPGKDGGFMYWPHTQTKGLKYWQEYFTQDELFSLNTPKKKKAFSLKVTKDSQIKNWWKVPGPVPGVINGETARIVVAPPGCLVLWPSTTVHANAPPVVVEGEETAERAVAYICQHKRSLATPTVLKRRIAYVEQGSTTSHWPHRFVKKKC